jgi:predicted AlkP superfamily pyrophosphatase or phosphodiesterase
MDRSACLGHLSQTNHMPLPDYAGGSIVNLVSSIATALGNASCLYPPLRELPPSALGTGNVVLLVIDGLGHDYLAQAQPTSCLRQHLRAAITSVFPSTTATAITTFLTGLAPQQHGLTGWHVYFKELGTVAAVLPFRPRHGGPSLTQSGIDAATLFGHGSLFDRLTVRSFVVAPQRIVHSEFNLAHAVRALARGYGSLPQFFQRIEEALSGADERRYVYAYYPELDSLAHEHGIASTQVAAHFAELDAAFADFLGRIQGSGSTVVVTADHGFIDTGPDTMIEVDQHPALAETLVLPLCGESRAAYCYVHAHKREQFERYVLDELSEYTELFESAQLVERGYFGSGEPHPRLLERIGDYTLVMKQNYVIKDWLPNERRHAHIGVHGGVSEQEMMVPLIVVQT